MPKKRMIITDTCLENPHVHKIFPKSIVEYHQPLPTFWPWNCQGDLEYTTEISDLGLVRFCPACGAKFNLEFHHMDRDREGEITAWTVICGCTAKLTIYND